MNYIYNLSKKSATYLVNGIEKYLDSKNKEVGNGPLFENGFSNFYEGRGETGPTQQ